MNRTSPRAFTLVEVLATASIILILAGLLLPMFKKTQLSARSALCTGNLKNLGAAFQLYAADNNGMLPAMRYRSSSVGANPNPGQNNWQFEIFPYLDVAGTTMRTVSQKGSSQHVFCPEYAREFKTDSEVQGLKCAGYGMAPVASGAYDNRIASAAVAKPTSTILAGDSDDYHLDIDANSWKEPDDKNRYGSGDPVRHGTTANYLFVDGHVRPLTQKQAVGILTKTEAP